MEANLITFYIFSFIVGLCIGSFLNAFEYRFNKKISIAQGRSFCPKCKHHLGVLDLFPILSFLALRAKCRYCKAKISWQYPIVELLTGVLFLLTAFATIQTYNSYSSRIIDFIPALAFGLLAITLCSIFVLITVYDIKEQIIPNEYTIAGIIATLIYIAFQNYYLFANDNISYHKAYESFEISIINLGTGAIVGFGLLLLVVLATRGKGMGMGDVKFAFLMGLILGFPKILIALYIAIIIGAVSGIALIIIQKKKLKSALPFGPYLILGTLITLFWGQEILFFIKEYLYSYPYGLV